MNHRNALLERFYADGFASVPAVLPAVDCCAVSNKIAALGSTGAGSRCLLAEEWCRSLAHRLQRHPAISDVIPADFAAVQCTYFEKSVERNWLVPIHQDLSIPVSSRVEHSELRGWSEKEGGIFVQPPAEFLGQLVALRIHLDPCLAADGPLQFIPGTHAYGRLSAEEVSGHRKAVAPVSCPMARGDALLMRPLVLHTSSKADGQSRRRVLHFVFGPRELPFGLSWQRTA
jgi:ectoine hydroxylase-related dioxygenase (phytanoyl-CoA dioxygenase family)